MQNNRKEIIKKMWKLKVDRIIKKIISKWS